MPYQYSSSDFDRPEFLLSLLGSYWSRIYGGSDQFLSLVTARAQLEKQAFVNTQELFAGISRRQVPVLHTENWQLLTLKESQRNSRLLALGGPAVLGFDPVTGFEYSLGQPFQPVGFEYPLPATLVDVGYIFNRIT